MPEFKSYDDLYKHIKKEMASVLDKEVLTVVRLEQDKALDEDVYSYSPTMYWDRRMYSNGGLLSSEQFHGESVINKNGVSATYMNTARRNRAYGDWSEGWLTPLIVNGHRWAESNLPEGGYSYANINPYLEYLRPRPFIRHTIEALGRNKRHVYAMDYGLANRGISARRG